MRLNTPIFLYHYTPLQEYIFSDEIYRIISLRERIGPIKII